MGNDRQAIYRLLKEGSRTNEMMYTSGLVALSSVLLFFSICVWCTGGAAIMAQKKQGMIIMLVYLVGAVTSVVLSIFLVINSPKAVHEKEV